MAENEVQEQSPGIERERALGSFSYDSLDVEAASLTTFHPHHSSEERNQDWGMVLRLAFQSMGIVYGDIGTSPLYVYASTFPDGIGHEDDILGVLCLIIYTITLIILVKYVFIVLRANDNGDGLLPSQQADDRDVFNHILELSSCGRSKRASKVKAVLKNSPFAKYFLLVFTMLGTSMVIEDEVLTPCI